MPRKVTKVSLAGAAMKWTGVPEMAKLLNQFGLLLGEDGMGQLRDEIKEILMKPALVLRDEARDLAPLGKTGRLKAGIEATKGPDNKPGVLVRAKTFYSWMVEAGTTKMTARPFFRPAVLAVKPLIAQMISEDIKGLIERTVEKLAYHPK